MKRLILAALCSGAVFAFPASALASDGDVDSDDGGAVATVSHTSNWAICHDGILSDDIGQGCTNDAAYGWPYDAGAARQATPTYHSYHHTYTPTSSSSTPSYSGGGYAGGKLASIRACESGGSGGYSANTGNGYYGAYQFTLSTWQAMGGTGLPSNASPAEQDALAAKLYAGGAGASNWPVCAYR